MPDRVKIDVEPRRFMVLSEPYVAYSYFGYTVALLVFEKKTRREYEMLIGSKSLSDGLKRLAESNGEKFTGLDFWVRKESNDTRAKYMVEE